MALLLAKHSPEMLMQRSDRLFARLRNMLFYWQAIAELFYPERADFTVQRTIGDERLDNIFTGTPMMLRRDLSNKLGAMLRPRGTDWFSLQPSDDALAEMDVCKRWCEDSTQRLRRVLYAGSANFPLAMRQSDDDYVAFGTSIVWHGYNKDKTGLLFKCLHPRDCAWAEDEDGKINELHQCRKIENHLIPEMFPDAILPDEIKRQAKDEPFAKREVRIIVLPKQKYGLTLGKPIPAAAVFACVYIDKATGTVFAEESYKVFPYLVRRWMNVSGEVAGRSPCTGVALADARTLNVAQMSIIEAIEKMVEPPMLAPANSVVGDLSIHAGGMTFYDPDGEYKGRRPIDTLETGDPQIGLEFGQKLTDTLGIAFYVNLLTLPSDKEMTAYEASERIEEYVRAAAPVFEPMEAENSQLMDGAFDRAADQHTFAPAPQELAGGDVRFEFVTPLTIAYKKQKVLQAQGVMQIISPLIESGIDPEAGDNVIWDEVVRDALEGTGPIKWITPPDQVAQIRQQRAQKQQAMQALQMAAAAHAASQGQPPAPGGKGAPPPVNAPIGTPSPAGMINGAA